ncbi:MAG: hypothetical protein N4A72_18195 [Bacteroidales bacterium]|jgi:hypothetical protein|nr:hypothetical protein [Bacteroidales bacterium]
MNLRPLISNIILVAILQLTFFTDLKAEENAYRTNELGFVVRHYNAVALTYSFGNYKSPWYLNFGQSRDYDGTTLRESNVNEKFEYGLGFVFGREFRVPVSKWIGLRYGAGIGTDYFKYDEMSNTNNYYKYVANGVHDYNSYSVVPAFKAVLGLDIFLGNYVVLGVSALPFIRYRVDVNEYIYATGTQRQFDSNFEYGLNASSASLSLKVNISTFLGKRNYRTALLGN